MPMTLHEMKETVLTFGPTQRPVLSRGWIWTGTMDQVPALRLRNMYAVYCVDFDLYHVLKIISCDEASQTLALTTGSGLSKARGYLYILVSADA